MRLLATTKVFQFRKERVDYRVSTDKLSDSLRLESIYVLKSNSFINCRTLKLLHKKKIGRHIMGTLLSHGYWIQSIHYHNVLIRIFT